MGKIRLILCDGNKMTRALLNTLFEESKAVEIVGEAADHKSAMALIREFTPDAVIIGYDLPAGEEFELRASMRAERTQTEIIELSELDDMVSDKIRPAHCLQFQQSAMIH